MKNEQLTFISVFGYHPIIGLDKMALRLRREHHELNNEYALDPYVIEFQTFTLPRIGWDEVNPNDYATIRRNRKELTQYASASVMKDAPRDVQEFIQSAAVLQNFMLELKRTATVIKTPTVNEKLINDVIAERLQDELYRDLSIVHLGNNRLALVPMECFIAHFATDQRQDKMLATVINQAPRLTVVFEYDTNELKPRNF